MLTLQHALKDPAILHSEIVKAHGTPLSLLDATLCQDLDFLL